MINTILVIDDCTLDNAILRNLLYTEHYNTISALNSHEALDLIESRNVDLILLDMAMPVLNGVAFLKEFQKTVYYHTVPVIMVTSADKTDIIEQVINEYDIFDYILKPFDEIKNLDSIHNLIFINKIKSALRYRVALKKLIEVTNKKVEDGQ